MALALGLGHALALTPCPGCEPVTIVVQPTNQTADYNGTVTFSVLAAGDPPLVYQWERSTDGGVSFAPLVGANLATINLSPVGAWDGYQYRVVVSNCDGDESVTSNAAILTVPFSPLMLSPALWLDGADTATITASLGSVSQWDDKSGNGRNVSQGTAAAQPTTAAATLNGLNVLSCDGGDLLSGSSALLVNSSNGTFSMLAVAKLGSLANTPIILSQDSGSGTRMPQYLRFTTLGAAQSIAFVGGTPVVEATASGSVSTGTAYQVTVLCTTIGLEAFVDGVGDGATAVSGSLNKVSSTIQVGAYYLPVI